jgi:hypothetical protein
MHLFITGALMVKSFDRVIGNEIQPNRQGVDKIRQEICMGR